MAITDKANRVNKTCYGRFILLFLFSSASCSLYGYFSIFCRLFCMVFFTAHADEMRIIFSWITPFRGDNFNDTHLNIIMLLMG